LPTIFFLGTAMGGVILWFGGSQVMSGSLTLDEFVAFIGYVGLLARPLTTLRWVISLAQPVVASRGRIEEILSTISPPTVPAQAGVAMPAPTGSAREQPLIVFQEVHFAYNGRSVLHGINLQGWRGELVAITRPSGAGKSTIGHLISRLEERLLKTIRVAARERLVLLITHRIKTWQAADRIIVVADGCIVAEGTHLQLLAEGGFYRQLYEHQCLRESLA
jgi:ABC-type multidrug transport system fused ATPase/permease subunit